MLAAPPAKRDDGYAYHRDGSHISPRGKGHEYTPVKVSRGYDRRDAGARSRHWLSQGGIEIGKLPKRQIDHGLSSISSELFSLGKGISENVKTNYDEEERRLFEVTREIKDLIKELESRDEVKT